MAIRQVARDTSAIRGLTSNCTLVAISQVIDAPFEKIEEVCRKHSYKPGYGMDCRKFFDAAKELGCNMNDVNTFVWKNNSVRRMTINEIRNAYPLGVYLIEINAHAIAMINGNIIDPNFNHLQLKCKVNKMMEVVNSPMKDAYKNPIQVSAELTLQDKIVYISNWRKHCSRQSDNTRRMYTIHNSTSLTVGEIIMNTNGFVSLSFIRNLIKRGICNKA